MNNQDKQNQIIKSLFAGRLGDQYFGKHVLNGNHGIFINFLSNVSFPPFETLNTKFVFDKI
jgi:hypothetical protein